MTETEQIPEFNYRPEQEMWLGELESGNWTQGSGVLSRVIDDVTRYCCLGVGSELAYSVGVITKETVFDTFHRPTVAYDGQRFALPPRAAIWLGLREAVDNCIAGIEYDSYDVGLLGNRTAFSLNDDGFKFDVIAREIRLNAPAVFYSADDTCVPDWRRVNKYGLLIPE